MGVPGRYEKTKKTGEPLPDDATSEEKKECVFVRIIKNIDVSEAGKFNFLFRAIDTTVYENTILAVLWKGQPEEECPVSNFKKELLKLTNVYYSQ